MIMWCYFGTGIGIKQKYSSIMNIKTSAKILKCFSDTESIQRKKNSFQRNKNTEHLIIFCIAVQQDVQKHLMKLQN